MVEKAGLVVSEVAVIDQNLLGGFPVGVLGIVKTLAVAHEKGHAHEDAVEPELVLAAGHGGVPEAAVAGARIIVEAVTKDVERLLVLWVTRFVVKDDQQIRGENVVE